MKLNVFDEGKNKMVLCGNLIGDTLFRDVKPQHRVRFCDGYAIQEIVFPKLQEHEVKNIVLKATDSKKRWKATVDMWMRKGFTRDLGHGKQRFLPVNYMDEYEAE